MRQRIVGVITEEKSTVGWNPAEDVDRGQASGVQTRAHKESAVGLVVCRPKWKEIGSVNGLFATGREGGCCVAWDRDMCGRGEGPVPISCQKSRVELQVACNVVKDAQVLLCR